MQGKKILGWVVFLGVVAGFNLLRHFGILDLGFWLI